MSTTATEDYVAKRAELLANLVLTRQKDVQVHRYQASADVGMDLIVQLPSVGAAKSQLFRPCFGVVVMGTDDSLETEVEATAYANRHWEDRPTMSFFVAPIVLFLFSMDGDKGYFSWVLEPKVTKTEGPTLTRVSSFEMTKITKASTEAIFRESAVWVEAMFQLLIRDKKK
jgi:hypothetical protein